MEPIARRGEYTLYRCGIEDLEVLVQARVEVLRAVFALPEQYDMEALAQANRAYYNRFLPAGGHEACMIFRDGEMAACGGVCLYEEMPLPDNPTGRCGYLMNIYTRQAHRRRGLGAWVVEYLTGRARAYGAGRVFLDSSQQGRALYAACGFVPMEDMMEQKGEGEG